MREVAWWAGRSRCPPVRLGALFGALALGAFLGRPLSAAPADQPTQPTAANKASGVPAAVLLAAVAAPAALDYTLDLTEMLPPSQEGGKWFQPRPVAIPLRDGAPLAVMTIQKAIGSDLGSYNTQQKWVTHSDGLFLVYTRRGANNDHIPRHRAPLFIARVDPEKLHVIRSTERIAVPERGADIGNFDATTVNAQETWITTAGGPAYLARIHWSRPNALAVHVN